MKSILKNLILFLAILYFNSGFAQSPKVVLQSYYNYDYGLEGFKDSASGKIVIPLQFESAAEFHEGMAVVGKEFIYGVINTQGKLVVPYKYWQINAFSEGLAAVQLDDKWGYINKTGAVVIPLKYINAESFEEGLAVVRVEGGKWGYINKTGQMTIPARFSTASNFKQGLATAELDGREVVLDKTGKVCNLPLCYTPLGTISPTLIIVWSEMQKYGIVDKTGKLVIDTIYDKISGWEDFKDEKYLTVEADGKKGWIDRKGTFVFKPQFDGSSSLENDSLTRVYVKVPKQWDLEARQWSIINLKSRKIITDRTYDAIYSLGDGMMRFELEGKVGYIDTYGKEKIPPMYEVGTDFENGLAIVRKEDGMYLINKNNQSISGPYDYIIRLDNEQLAVNNGGEPDEDNNIEGGLWGLLGSNGKPLTDLRFHFMEQMDKDYGVGRILQNDTMGIVRSDGTVRLFPDFHYLGEFKEGMAIVNIGGSWNEEGGIDGGKYGFINHKGDLAVPTIYDDGSLFYEGLARLWQGDSLYIVDKTGRRIVNITQYKASGDFHDGRAAVQNQDDMIGFIDRTGKLVIPCIYDDVNAFEDGLAQVYSATDGWMLIDTSGKVVKKLE